MSVSARRRAPTTAVIAATPLQVATICIAPGAALCATAAYWTTLRQVYPAATGAAVIYVLLLAAVALFAVAAGAGLAAFVTGRGAYSGRLRAAPLAAALVALAAAGAVLLAVWSATGDSAWQAPTEGVVAGAALVASALLALRVQPAEGWSLHRLGVIELQMLVAVGMAATLVLGLLARPWETTSLVGAAALPTWWLTTVSLAVGACAGQFLLQMLQRPGVGVMAMIVAFGMRALLIGVLQRPVGGFEGAAPAFLLAMAAAGILDLVYFFNLGRADEARVMWQALTGAVTATLIGSLLVLDELVAYPPVTAATIPGIVAAGALAGISAGYLGMAAGRWIAGQRSLAASAGARWLDFAGLGLTAAALVAVVAWAARLAG